MGEGLYPVRVKGYNEQGKEQIEVINDTSLVSLVNGIMIRKYLQACIRDIFKLGMSFPVLRFNEDGSKIARINTLNARLCRWEWQADGKINYCIVNDYRSTKAENISRLFVLDKDDPQGHLELLRSTGKTKSLMCVYPLENYFGNNMYYQIPDWYTAYLAGWMDISAKVPGMIKKMYENQITWKWHIKIPYSYWEKLYPKTAYKNEKERQALINTKLDEIETMFTGEENVNKAIITHFELNAMGKAEEQWEIEPLDNKYKNDQVMIEGAMADSNILFAASVNPTVIGAGLPGAGPYAGKAGGSDIRESFLIDVALAYLDRKNVLDPLELMLWYNGYPEDIDLRFKNTVLTTLDTGAGTQKTIS
jgi:hypothetical protein